MDNLLKASLGFKGADGDSAYDIAVKNGFEGTEQDWLATLGTAEHLTRSVTKITVSSTQNTFTVSSDLTSSSVADVFVNGLRKTEDSYTLNATAKTITFNQSLSSGDVLEVYISQMRSSELPIVTTINDSSTDNSAPSAKAVNTMKKELKKNIDDMGDGIGALSIAITNKMDFSNLAVVTSSTVGEISSGATEIVDLNYPAGFNQANTIIISKMVSSNNNYYDTTKSDMTASGFPVIDMVALTSSTIRVWLKNTNSTQSRRGHIKLGLLRTTAY